MVEEGRKQRNKLGAILSDSALHVAAKEALHAEAEIALHPARMAADILVMQTLENGGKLEADEREVLVDRLLSPELAQDTAAQNIWREKLAVVLKADNPGFTKPFHWVLEFPEVFDRENGGFDAVVGNPPFLGGGRISGTIGSNYREYLVIQEAHSQRGLADFVAYFFLRASKLIREHGDFGLIATNTIAQGETREVGLLKLERGNFTIRSAWPDVPWSGSATVATSQVCIHKERWCGVVKLKDSCVPKISSFLMSESKIFWEPKKLLATSNIAFEGSKITGSGFLLEKEHALKFINSNPANESVLYPYIGGEDLNSSPEQTPSRWVICFWDWPEEDAATYYEPFSKMEIDVKPIRQRQDNNGKFKLDEPLAIRWWQFARPRAVLYHKIGRGHHFINHPIEWNALKKPLERVLVMSAVSKHGAFSFIENRYIMAHSLNIFASDDAMLFALLQSGIHHIWARKMSSTLETRLRYTPSSAFETFPRPRFTSEQEQALRELGETPHQARADVMKERWVGLTVLYNMVHNPEVVDADILRLRELHEQVDQMVATAYGWDDLDLSHSFHSVDYLPANDRLRHTFSEAARFELLDRLTLLNKERWEEEQRAMPQAAKKAKKKKRAHREGPSLFDLL